MSLDFPNVSAALQCVVVCSSVSVLCVAGGGGNWARVTSHKNESGGDRRNHSRIYVPLLVYLSQKVILLIVQYKYLKSCSKNFKLQDVILRTRLCGTGFIPQHCRVVDFHLTKIVGGNFLYQVCTISERANRRGWTLNIFYMMRRARWLDMSRFYVK